MAALSSLYRATNALSSSDRGASSIFLTTNPTSLIFSASSTLDTVSTVSFLTASIYVGDTNVPSSIKSSSVSAHEYTESVTIISCEYPANTYLVDQLGQFTSPAL